ncbi:MAG: endo-1,4-beta-xylanase [Bacteroidota bacterium]
MKKIITIVTISFLFNNSCQKDNISICNVDDKYLSNCVDFYCGSVVDLHRINSNINYGNIVNTQFNSVTAENIMKPEFLHPGENTYNWFEADQLVDYCTSNSKRLHGHTLIWHQQLPQWMLHFEGSSRDWENMMKDHIFQIVSHFKGKVSSWDVVNEAFNDDGTLRNSIWKKNIGKSYIEKAFQFAQEADPNAKLFYNDYSLEINPVKRNAVLSFFNNLKAQGISIDGIGLQMHIFNGFPENIEVSKAIDDIWKNDYLVHISELDISINPLSQDMQKAPHNELMRQAEKYLYVFKSYDRIPDKYKFGITIWGVGDDDSWIRYYYNRDDYPLLFDDNYLPKPAFCKLISEL